MKHSQSKTKQAIIHLEVPEYQIGQEVSIYFKDTMYIKGTCEKPKTGHWIKSRDCYGNNHFTCSLCENDIATKADTWEDNYCSNCGARMESEG